MHALTQQLPAEPPSRLRLLDSLGKSDLLRVYMVRDAPGVLEVPGQSRPRVGIHAGRPVRIACKREGDSHAGIFIHGDIDIIPSGVESRWEMKEPDQCLVLSVSSQFLGQVAESAGLDAAHIGIQNRFQMRNPQIEHIGWALKAEVEQGYPNGRLYMDSLATALAVEMLHNRRLRVENGSRANKKFSWRGLKQVLAYIEDNLSEDLTLQTIANEIDVSTSLLKEKFRLSVGIPLHQYVIQRRVERAAELLKDRKLAISQVALETGFAHQSHLAMHMRRVLGVLPNDLRNKEK